MRAETCAADPVPAATLLLPYFEVDLSSPNGATTLMAINNADDRATLAHVTVWTDEAIPTLNFDIYLTGYDVQTINLRDLFTGYLPVTAPVDRDPSDTFSHRGPLSQDESFPNCGALPYGIPALGDAQRNNLRLAHTGQLAPAFGGCVGASYFDDRARGYVTVDVVSRCSTLDPSKPGYFTGVAADRNVLWGSYSFVDPARASAAGKALVHIESCSDPSVGTGSRCPFSASAPTFYGRYASVAGKDQREPLGTTYGAEYVLGGAFAGGTDLVVWRDTKALPTGPSGPHACNKLPPWIPLEQADVVAFDEQEQPTDLCGSGGVITAPYGPGRCFPLAAQRIHLAGGNVIGDDPVPYTPFGWIYLNLQRQVDPGQAPAQAWVSALMNGGIQYSVSADAVQFDRGCDAVLGGEVLIP